MGFDNSGSYSATHKGWDHVGNAIPVVEASEGDRPYGEFKPAAWLPVQFRDKFYEEWYVVMPGKLVAFDPDGRVVPAQYGLSGADVVYTQSDIDAGVIDVRTGAAVASAQTIPVSGIDGVIHHFMGKTGTALAGAVSAPAGAAAYAYFQWAGDGSAGDDGFNPAYYRKHNYNLQHRVAVVCDYVLELPLVPAGTTAENLSRSAYNATTDVVTGTALSNLPVAANTVRTPISFADGTETDSATVFVNQRDTLAEVVAAGDWHVDLTTGIISWFDALDPGAGSIYAVSYSNYASAPTGSSVSKFASAVGNLKAGDFVKCNADSNFTVATRGTDMFDDIMGQVLEVEDVKGKDYLDRVRTAFSDLDSSAAGAYPGTAGQLDQMPGSATGGVTDKVNYAGAANLVVRINLVSR